MKVVNMLASRINCLRGETLWKAVDKNVVVGSQRAPAK